MAKKKKAKKVPAYDIGPAYPEYRVREVSESLAYNVSVYANRDSGITLERKYKYHTMWDDDNFACNLGEEETRNLIAALGAALADCAKRDKGE